MPLTLTQSAAVLSKGQEKFAYRRLPEAMINAEIAAEVANAG